MGYNIPLNDPGNQVALAGGAEVAVGEQEEHMGEAPEQEHLHGED